MRERHGSLLVDALLAIVIFGAIVAAFSSGVMQGQFGTVKGNERIRALYIAEEGLNAVRWIRDKKNGDGTLNIGFSELFGTSGTAPLWTESTQQTHGVRASGAAWTIQTGAPTVVDGIFTRKLKFTDAGDGARAVESIVTWQGNKGQHTVSLSTILADWQTAPAPSPDWSRPLYRGSLANISTKGSLQKVAIKGNYAYIAVAGDQDKYGLIIVDISNFGAPQIVKSINLGPPNGASAYNVALNGNYAYVATDETAGEVKVIDISNPLTANCSSGCAGTIDISGQCPVTDLVIAEGKLYVTTEEGGSCKELCIFDITSNPTNPSCDVLYDTKDSEGSPGIDSLFAVAVASDGGSPPAFYAYTAASTGNDEELRVIKSSDGVQTGNGSAAGTTKLQGTAVAVYGNGAYVGAKGADMCELFAFNIAGKVSNPNTVVTCGGNQAYDLGGDNDTSEEVADMQIVIGGGLEFPLLFMATDAIKAGKNFHLHVLNATDPSNLGSPVYNGSIVNVTDGYNVENGLAYRLSDHTLVMVGGDDPTSTTNLLILQPSFTFN